MPKLSLSLLQIEFIKANRLIMSGSAMAKQFGLNKSIVNRYMRKHNLTAPKDLFIKWRSEQVKGLTSYSIEDDQYIRDNYLILPIKKIAENIGGSYTGVMGRLSAMGLTIPDEIINHRKNIGRIKPGNIPFTKGKKQTEFMSADAIERTKPFRFKAGHLPPNTYKEMGVIVIRKDKRGVPYNMIKLGHRNWIHLHVQLYKMAFGEIPKGNIIRFKDGNTMNCTLDNLEMITRKENMERNTIQRFPKELKEVIQLNNRIKRKLNERKQASTK